MRLYVHNYVATIKYCICTYIYHLEHEQRGTGDSDITLSQASSSGSSGDSQGTN